MAKKYYAVRVGIKTGIYLTWDECKSMVNGYPGAVYKSFTSREEAEAFLDGVEHKNVSVDEKGQIGQVKEPYAFVDGSFNSVTKVYGYGGFLIADGQRYVLQDAGNKPELVEMNNVAGEIAGSMAAVNKAIELPPRQTSHLMPFRAPLA